MYGVGFCNADISRIQLPFLFIATSTFQAIFYMNENPNYKPVHFSILDSLQAEIRTPLRKSIPSKLQLPAAVSK